MVVSKKCSKCNIVKDESEFYVDYRTGSPQSWCKDCKKKYNLLWKKTPIGKAAARRYKNGPAGKAAARHYKNGPAGKAAARRWARSPKGKEYEIRRAQSRNGREYQRRYSQSSAGKAREKRYYQWSKGKKSKARYRPQLRTKVLLKIGRGRIECAECGFNIQSGLDINHENGDGNIDRKEKYKNRSTFYTAVLRGHRSIRDLILLCKPCHQLFHFEKKYGSHWSKVILKKEINPLPARISAKKGTIALSTVFIAAVMVLLVSSPLIATYQSMAFYDRILESLTAYPSGYLLSI